MSERKFIESHELISRIKSGRYMLAQRKTSKQYTVFSVHDDDDDFTFDNLSEDCIEDILKAGLCVDFLDDPNYNFGLKFKSMEEYMTPEDFIKLWKRKMFLDCNE